MADQGDEIEHIHVSSDDINPYVSDDELRITFDDGNHSADEDELNATNSSLAYLTQVRKARKKASDVAPSRTCTVRMIACTGFGFLIICLAMVGVSLVMSKDIDSLVRNSNEMLRKHNDRMSQMRVPDFIPSSSNETGLL